MSDSSPLAGLTVAQADEAIERLAAKVEQQEASLKASKAQLKELKAARKDLPEQLPEPGGDGTRVHAQTAEAAAEGGEA